MSSGALGPVSVIVSHGGSDSEAISEGVYTYREDITVMSMHPSYGWTEGGNMVTVVGQNLATRDLFCVFGEASEVAAETVTSSSLRCRTPASAGGETVDMRVMDAGVEVKRFRGSFRYMGRVEVSKLRPSVGPIAGGLQAIVEGSGLRKELDVTCHFGGAESRGCLLYTSPSPRDVEESRMPSSA